MLYTDGLVERRRQPLTAGIGQVVTVIQNGRAHPIETLATDVMDQLSPPGGYDDDVAVLLYRHPGPLELDFAAEATGLAPVRSALRSWLERCGLSPTNAYNVLVAAGEACANAIEHGHRDNPADGSGYGPPPPPTACTSASPTAGTGRHLSRKPATTGDEACSSCGP